MGLVLDSGVLIAAERGAKPVSAMLLELEQKHGETEVVISWITVIELEHGLHRANTQALPRQRRAYLDTVFLAIPVEPITKEMGQLAAKIDADAKRAGLSIPFEDLLIGVTALHQGLWDRYAESPALSHDSEPERDRVLAHTAHSSVTVEGPISWQMPWTYVIASGVTVTVTHTVAGTGALDRRPIRSMEFLGGAPELIVPTRLTLCGPAAGRHCHRRSINRGNS